MEMTKVSVAKARKELADLVSRAAYGKERIVVEKHGKPACAIIPMEALQALEEWERLEDEADLKTIERRRGEPSRPWEEVKKSLAGAARKKRRAA
jgi:prevent-host-death family protein